LRTRTLALRVVALGAALALSSAGVALAAATNGRYSGSTTQTGQPGGTVRFSVSSGSVRGFSGDAWASCHKTTASETIPITVNPTPDMAIHDQTFTFNGNFSIDNGRVVIAKHVEGTITGKFVSGKKATGTMRFTWTFDKNAPSSFPGQRCTTGTVSYTAKHA
jgi:hypothetical protein